MIAPSTDQALSKLALQSGLLESWQDVHGVVHHVEPAVLRVLLEALGLPCGSHSQIRESQGRLDRDTAVGHNAMVFADIGSPLTFNYRGPMNYRVALENGEHLAGTAVQTGSDTVGIGALNVPGYHMLEIGDQRIPLTIAPMRGPSIAELAGRENPHLWGIAIQLYSLRRPRDDASGHEPAGLTEAGDYAALAQFAGAAARRGADAVAISPVHAMFSADPERYSPYAPSSRIFLNVNFVDPAMVLGVDAVNAAQARAARPMPAQQERVLIDWPEVSRTRMQTFLRAFERFESGAPRHLLRAFENFRERGGEMLQRHGCYETLHAHFAPSLGASCGWQDWPAQFRDPQSRAVGQFSAEHARDVRFHVFLQWLADEGLRLADNLPYKAEWR